MNRIDGRAVLVGAVVSLVIAVPPAILAQIESDRDALEGSNWVLLLFALVLVAFVAGGYVTAKRAQGEPLVNGALAAVTAFVIVQGVGIVRRLADGDEIRWFGILFAALLAASCGTVGAIVATAREHRAP